MTVYDMNLRLCSSVSYSVMWDNCLDAKRGTTKETGQREFYTLEFMHFVQVLEKSYQQCDFLCSEGLYVTRSLDVQGTSIFTGSWVWVKKTKCVKHRRQIEKQSSGLSGQINNSHLPMLNFPLDSHEIPWIIWMKVCNYWKRTSIREYFNFDIYPKDIHMHITVLKRWCLRNKSPVPCC